MRLYKYALGLLLLLSAVSLYAQEDLFQWNVVPSQEQVARGGNVQIQATLEVAPDHIVYEHMTSVSIQTPEGIVAGETISPQAHEKVDPTDGQVKRVYDGTVQFRIPIMVAPDAQPGPKELNLTIKYQGCSQTLCYFPMTNEVPVTLTVSEEISPTTGESAAVGSAAPPSDAGPALVEGSASSSAATLSTGTGSDIWTRIGDPFSFAAMFWIFIVGLGMCLTPCVYPLIPITVSIFGARDTKSKWEAFTLAATFVLGIALMFSSLGVLAASTGMIFGQYMSNPWVVGVIALIFTAMGISMLGGYDFRLPASVQNRLMSVGGKGYGSAFVMGLASGVVAAPCTGPVTAGILTWIAAQGDPVQGFVLLFVFALGLGLPFLLLGTFSSLIQHMPRSGGWMESVKSVFGIILLAVALFYLKDAFKFLRAPLEHSTITYIIAFVLLGAGIAIGAVHLSFHHRNLWVRLRKGMGVVLCVFALYLGAGSLTQVQATEVDWVYSLEEGLAMAKEQNRPVMIDFYADWCAACKELDAFTYSNEEVGVALERFVNIKVDLTDDNATSRKIMEAYDIPGLPIVDFYNSKGEVLRNKRITGFVRAQPFLEHIRNIE